MAKYAQLTATGLPHGVLLTVQDSTGKQVPFLYPEANANAPDNRARFADGTGAISPATYVPNGTYIVAYSGGSQTVVVSGATGAPADSMFVDLATQAELDAAGTAASGTYPQKVVAASGDATGVADVAAINAALTAGSRVFLVPNTTYYCNAPIYVPSHCVLDATGATVNLVGATTNLIRTTSVLATRAVADAVSTAGSSTLGSPSGSFTAGDVGSSVGIVGAGISGSVWYGTITAYTNATTVTVSTPARATVSGAALSIYRPADRCKDVTVRGGNWVVGSAFPDGHQASSTAFNSFATCFRRVDGLRLENMRWTTAGTAAQGGKFTVSVADVTDFSIDNIEFVSTAGDGVHITGPAAGGSITNVRGTTGDDMVVLNTQDSNTPLITDTQGNLDKIDIRGIVAVNTWNPFKFYDLGTRGQFTITQCSVDGITGSSQNMAANVYGTPTMDLCSIRNVKVYTHYAYAISLGDGGDCNNIADIDIENVECPSNVAFTSGIVNIIGPRGPVRVKNITQLAASASGTSYGVYVTGVAGPASGSAFGSSFHIDGIYQVAGKGAATGTFHPVGFNATGSVQAIHISNVQAMPVTAGTLFLLTAAAIIRTLKISDSTFVGTNLVSVAASVAAFIAQIENVTFTGASLVTSSSPVTVVLSNVDAATTAGAVAATGAGATPVRVRASTYANSGAGANLTRDGTQALSVDGPSFRCDQSILTPSDGDLIYNTNASPLNGVGVAIYNTAATKWKNVYSGTTS